MRNLSIVLILAAGCSTSPSSSDQKYVQCSGSDIPIYSPRYASQYGGSGVATPADAAAGRTSSDPNAPIPQSDPGNTAMVVRCGQAPACGQDQVGIEYPSPAGGGATGGGDALPPTSVPTGGPVRDPSTGDPATTGTGTADSKIVCASPPPFCGPGLSPQYTDKGGWECTDCALVVTYGGIYGNTRLCTSLPDLMCPEGETPTWVFEDDSWECQPTCDNGQYDQHVIGGEMVCVPC
jgi:hypothetical protein